MVGPDALQRAGPVSTKEQALDAQRQLYDSRAIQAPRGRCVPVSRRRSLLSREAGSLISHTKILRLLLADAGRAVPPEVNAALLTFEGWAVSLIAAEINQPLWPPPEPSMLMAEIRSVLAAMPDGRLERILRDLPYRRLYTVLYELRRDYREDDS
jgi:hypothetical protein